MFQHQKFTKIYRAVCIKTVEGRLSERKTRLFRVYPYIIETMSRWHPEIRVFIIESFKNNDNIGSKWRRRRWGEYRGIWLSIDEFLECFLEIN